MAKDKFEMKYNLKVLPAGLFIDVEYNFLASLPDGLIRDNDIVKIKCPPSIKDMTPKEKVLAKKIKFLTNDQDENIELKKTIIITIKSRVNLGNQ